VNKPIPGVPWYQCLMAHALIQAGGVALVTGSVLLGGLEAIAHFGIDYLKCRGAFSYNIDQALHVACKVAWMALLQRLL